jgi:hypothetical protein
MSLKKEVEKVWKRLLTSRPIVNKNNFTNKMIKKKKVSINSRRLGIVSSTMLYLKSKANFWANF